MQDKKPKWEYVDGEGLWQRYKNNQTGEMSLKEHKLIPLKEWCRPSDHTFDDEIPTNRRIQCLNCGQEILFIVGKHFIKDGKLKSLLPNRR